MHGLGLTNARCQAYSLSSLYKRCMVNYIEHSRLSCYVSKASAYRPRGQASTCMPSRRVHAWQGMLEKQPVVTERNL